MKTRQLAACTLILSLAAAGCGSSANNAATADVPPASPTGSAESAASPADNGIGATPTATQPPRRRSFRQPPPPRRLNRRSCRPRPSKSPAGRRHRLSRCSSSPSANGKKRASPPDSLRRRTVPTTSSRARASCSGRLTADEPEHVFLDLTADDADRELEALAVSPDGKWFAVGDSEGTLRIWSLEDRKELVSKQLYRSGIQHIAISPDASEIATITYDSDVTIWTADKLEQKQKFKVTASGVERIEYVGPNLLAAAGESTTMWNTNTGAKAHDLPAGRYNFALARTSDGTKFIFGAEEALNIWDVATAKPDATVIRGVAGNVLLSVSRDGKTLATTDGRSVDLWSLSDGRRLQSIQGFGWTIVGVSWLPTTNLLAVASDIGVTRIWGTPAQGESLGLKPLHTPVAMPAAGAKEPATPEQLEQMIDWRTFPTLPGSVSGVHSSTDLSSVAPVSIPEARAFYRYFLTKAGWTESPQDPNNPTSMEFRKNGSEISGYFYDAGDGKTNINLHHAGNYDVRWAPKADGAAVEIVYENAQSSVLPREGQHSANRDVAATQTPRSRLGSVLAAQQLVQRGV